MNRNELQATRTALRTVLARLDAIPVRCASCRWQEGVSCGKFDATPPPDVVQAGCEAWEHDQVPF